MSKLIVRLLIIIGTTTTVVAQDLHWIENQGFDTGLGNPTLVNTTFQSQSYLLSAEVLESNTSTGSVQLTNFLVDGNAISENDQFVGITELYVSPVDRYNQSALLNNGYSIRIQKFGAGIGPSDPNTPLSLGYNITVFGPKLDNGENNKLGGLEDVTFTTSSVLKILKTGQSTVEIRFDNESMAIVSDATAPYYRVAIRSTVNDASFNYSQSGFEETDDSYPLPEVSSSDLNYTFVRSYDIRGKLTGAGVAFFDELGRPTQSQTKDILTQRNWATETLYDSQGRAALSTMSSPIGAQVDFSYKDGFIRDSGGAVFSTSDLNSAVPELPSPVNDAPGTLGWYYSNENTNEPYQDVTNRPYSRTVYDELNPGNVRAIVGGDTAQGGQDPDFLINFPQGFRYTMPATQELYYAFGKDYFPENSEGWFAAHGLTGYADNPSTYFISHRATKSVSIDAHGNEVVAFTDLEGKTLAAARSGGLEEYPVISLIGAQGYVDVHIPKGISNNDIQFLGSPDGSEYTIYDIRRGIEVDASSMTGGNIYRIEYGAQSLYDTVLFFEGNGALGHTGPARGIKYKVNYYDFSLNYYDDAGNLKESVQPLGFDNVNLQSGNPNATPQHSHISNYDYNSLGQLLNTSSPDEGSATFVYRSDGQIRFSQNTKQLENSEYSYTNYDSFARPIQSGVCQGNLPIPRNPGFRNSLALEVHIPETMQIVDDRITKTVQSGSTTTSKWQSGGFYGTEAIEGDFELSFRSVSATDGAYTFFGLSENDYELNNPTKIDFAIYRRTGNTYQIRENNSTKTPYLSGYTDDQTFQIQRIDNVITYSLGTSVIYQNTNASEAPLFLHGNLLSLASIEDISLELLEMERSEETSTNDFVVLDDASSEQTFTLYDVPDEVGLTQAFGNDRDAIRPLYTNQQWLSGNVSKTWTMRPQTNMTWYSYDVYGRVDWMVQNTNDLGVSVIDYQYDVVSGQVTKIKYIDHNDDVFVHRYTYNEVNQLVEVETSTDNNNFTIQASYEYYETGALKRTVLADGLQGIDYVYNINGALKSINHPSLDPAHDPGQDTGDVFGMIIDYHKRDYLRNVSTILKTDSGLDRYDGNIKGVRWGSDSDRSNTGSVAQKAYLYEYDKNKWLQSANFGSATSNGTVTLNPQGDYRVDNLTYDPNGNIESLSRKRNTLPSLANNDLDEFVYNYISGTNQLSEVIDTANNSGNEDEGDLKSQTANNYVYNSIGQLISNAQDGINYSYTTSGLVDRIDSSVEPGQFVDFTYGDRGKRIGKTSSSGATGGRTYYVRDASGQPMAIYSESRVGAQLTALPTEYPIYGLSRLGVQRDGVESYELTDHLGNVRAVVKRGVTAGTFAYNEDFSTDNGNWISISNAPEPEWSNQTLKTTFSVAAGFDSKVASPTFELESGTSYRMSFVTTEANDPDVEMLMYVIDENNTPIARKSIQSNGTNQRHLVVLNPLISGSHRIIFAGRGGTVAGDSQAFYNVFVDKIQVVSLTNSDYQLAGTRDYYPGGMAMPNLNVQGDYRYGYQGQEKDPETEKEAFELRLWDARIGRWLTTDPYGQFHSPYLGMGNNPVSVIDPDGGFACIDAEGNPFPCPEGYDRYNDEFSMFHENNKDAYFGADGKFVSDAFKLPPAVIGSGVFSPNSSSASLFIPLAFRGGEEINIGRLKKSGQFRIYNAANDFRGNPSTDVFRLSQYAKGAGIAYTIYQLGGNVLDVANAGTPEAKKSAQDELIINGGVTIGAYLYPPIGVTYMAGDIISNTDTYQIELHRAKERKRANDGIWEGNLGGNNATFRSN